MRTFLAFVSVLFFFCLFLLGGAAPVFSGEYENMAFIPGGSFTMGSNQGDPDERPKHEVFLEGFFIDAFEVTNSDYTHFLNEKGNRVEEGAPWIFINSEYCRIQKEGGHFIAEEGYEDHPVVMVNYYGALAYARHLGKRLPTEAEWEKAARGGIADAPYPWGHHIDTSLANFERKRRGTTPVGAFRPNGFGLFDMAGNVSEMVSDFYADDYYKRSPERNPRGPELGEVHTIRGGDWLSGTQGLRVSNREAGTPPSLYLPNVGFRCVKDVE
jgi:formylglycine-generating enzyme required for sulfatase activity